MLNIAKLLELGRERYCGQLQSYQYQPLVQYTQVKACRSALAACSNASSGTSKIRISSSVPASLTTSLFIDTLNDFSTTLHTKFLVSQALKTKRVPVYERSSLFGISALTIS
jgi:hypothetical protein